MNLRRIGWLMLARNREFYRDRASLGWNLLFPFLMVGGFGFIFSDQGQSLATVGVLAAPAPDRPPAGAGYHAFRSLQHLRFVEMSDPEEALRLLRHHKIDLLVAPGSLERGGASAAQAPPRYWVNQTSPRGYLAERLLLGAPAAEAVGERAAMPSDGAWQRQAVTERPIPYTAWMFPGLLSLNLMWMSLYGVGWSIVRSRHNGVLKRYRATPVTALEYVTAQVLSRVLLMSLTGLAVYAGSMALFGFRCAGSSALLALTLILGTLCATSIGLVIASRSASQELVGGVLNLVAPTMMLLGEVWFSLEGSPGWVKAAANLLPLTHCVSAARQIMNDGAGLAQVQGHLLVLSASTLVFMVAGASLFRWHRVD